MFLFSFRSPASQTESEKSLEKRISLAKFQMELLEFPFINILTSLKQNKPCDEVSVAAQLIKRGKASKIL